MTCHYLNGNFQKVYILLINCAKIVKNYQIKGFVLMKKKLLQYTVIQTLPVFCGYLFLGIAFGLLLANAGYGFLWAFLASGLIYAGSIQFVMVNFLASGTGLLTVAFMTLLINSRHLFYGLTFIEKFKKMGRRYPYMIFSLTDETYSLLCSLDAPKEFDEQDVYFSISAMDQLYWVFGSVLGAAIGQLLPFDTTGIDFAMTALFVVIFVEQWLSFPTHFPAVTALISGIVCLAFFGASGFILPSLVITVTVLLCFRKKLEPFIAEQNKEKEDEQ